MGSARPLFFHLLIAALIVGCGTAARAADDKTLPQTSGSAVQGQALDPITFWQLPESQPPSTDLSSSGTRTRVDLGSPAGKPRSAIFNGAACYTMRMYKVKGREHFAVGESASRGYSTCELASNYQMRSAVARAHIRGSQNSTNKEPNK